MSELDKLLEGVEVEWSTLGNKNFVEIANSGRKPVKASLRIAGEIPYYGANNIQDYVEGYTHEGKFILIAEDGSKSLENYSIQYAVGKFWANNHIHVIRGNNEITTKFLYHYLQIVNFIPFLSGGGRAKLTKGQLINIPFPIPCPNNPEKSLKIQKEIVRILDTFTELTTKLTTKLTTELTARKKQYSYHREQLLTFEDSEVEWKTLGEVAEYSKTRISFENLNEDNYVGVDNLLQNRLGKKVSSRVPTKGNSTQYIVNDILIGNIRPYLKKIWFSDCIGGTNGDVLVIRITDSKITPKYLYQILADDSFFEYNMQHAKGAKMPRGNKSKIMEYLIPIPPIEEQERIVTILDKFDTLTTSISEGLPKEIDLRKKQYEYYREMLLTFPKPE
ncbi:restriction endonuclease subunit S [Polaribacter sp. R2A056_3_33]|uniref:restriction endonuclease subunit S n=1 Tax=Polaribacter sp. R2A056_3_33 TaxID=2745563 RepID=UPI001C501B22|nr:restriction endonuclease subunit S [Polaribacter sp. R2A056_3_33]QXP69316.1 restriction endonuclease subunit S [Polaribacter sp. R2A056_3_33]